MFWRVISGTHVYGQTELDIDRLQATIPTTETGPIYIFPLSEGDCWDRRGGEPVEAQDCLERDDLCEVLEKVEPSPPTDNLGTRVLTFTYNTWTYENGYEGIEAQIELDACVTDCSECFLIMEWDLRGGHREYFCPGVGSIGGFWNHAETPWGHAYYLIDYSLEGTMASTPIPTREK
jgi:hypothetical protein